MDKLNAWTEINPNPDFLPQTRCHPLRIRSEKRNSVWIKREDESSFGIPGPKLRKYASLMPNLMAQGIRTALLIGGAYSNNLAALPQLLIENQINCKLILRGESNLNSAGNLLLIRMLNSTENLRWIPRNQWDQVQQWAEQFQQTIPAEDQPSIVIPEGAFMPETLKGSMTLGADIRRNEKQHSLFFKNILIDSGTGLSAIAAMFDDFPFHPERKWHILLSAGNPDEFNARLETVWIWYQQLHPEAIQKPDNFILHAPGNKDRFGKINESILSESIRIAREQGILTDPVYGTKLWLLMESLLQENALIGNTLFIHSGGSSLWGFQEKLSKLIS